MGDMSTSHGDVCIQSAETNGKHAQYVSSTKKQPPASQHTMDMQHQHNERHYGGEYCVNRMRFHFQGSQTDQRCGINRLESSQDFVW